MAKNKVMIHERGYWLDKEEIATHMHDEALCDAIIKTFSDVRTIIDIGCGDGYYTKRLTEHGFECIGFDGSPLTPEITNGICEVRDFSEQVNMGEFDLVLSLEVGEHIPDKYEQVFIDNLICASKGYICLSWGVEGQQGVGHVNCRNNDYVIKELFERGFIYSADKSQYLRDNSTLPWFKNTVLIFYK